MCCSVTSQNLQLTQQRTTIVDMVMKLLGTDYSISVPLMHNKLGLHNTVTRIIPYNNYVEAQVHAILLIH